MSLKFCLLLVSILATVALLSCQQAQPPTNLAENKTIPAQTETAKKAAPTDLETLSNRLVTQVAGVKEGEIVFVRGGVRDLELLENINTDVRKAGAFPLLTIGSDRMFKKYYEEVPEKYDSPYRAKQFGMSQDNLAKTFWEAVNSDYTAVQTAGEKVKGELSTGKEVHITNPNGTDLKVSIASRPFFVSDGIISADDVKKGGPAVSVYLPAGEVFCAPVPGSAAGKVVESQTFFRGKEVNNLTLTFAAGRLTQMTGSGSGFADLKAEYDASGDGKELFAFVDFGINPNLHIWPTSKLGNWIQSGMVTVGIGNNAWAGGDNKVSYGMTNYLPGSTVTVDGKTVVENGVLKL